MLQAVEPVEAKRSVADGYEPILLSTQELFDKYWAQCVPLFERVVDEAMHGELTVDDMYTRALAGQMYIIVAKNDETEVPDVRLAMALELVYYPRYTAMNVVAIGGKDLRPMIRRFWKYVCGWAYICGVRKMECSVAPAMEKILEAVGFERHYVQMRQDLTEV